MTDLKNCPICDHEAEIVWDSCNEQFVVECTYCGTKMPGGGVHDRAYTVEKWNERPIGPKTLHLQKIVVALEEGIDGFWRDHIQNRVLMQEVAEIMNEMGMHKND